MSQPESFELQAKTKDVVSVEASSNPEDAWLYSQTRTRKLFSFSQLFAFSLTYMALWEGMCTSVTNVLARLLFSSEVLTFCF